MATASSAAAPAAEYIKTSQGVTGRLATVIKQLAEPTNHVSSAISRDDVGLAGRNAFRSFSQQWEGVSKGGRLRLR